MANHFSSIGFPIYSEEALEELVQTLEVNEVFETMHGHYLLSAPGKGVELWLQADHDRNLIGIHPHFSGSGRMKVALTTTLTDEEMPLDGSFHGWADPEDDDPESGCYPFLFDAPDFFTHDTENPLTRTVTVQLAAFAEELNYFRDEEAYYRSQEEGEISYAVESFIPIGLFTDKAEASPSAHALFTGRIQDVEIKVNPLTKNSFYHILVQTLGGSFDVVSDPSLLDEKPIIGGVVSGTFWLSGRILDKKE